MFFSRIDSEPLTLAGNTRKHIDAQRASEVDAASAFDEDDGEEDNERSEQLFGYDPDGNGNVWDEYQAVMGDPMFAW